MARETLVVVHYDDLPTAQDEVVYKNSPRLAKHGIYTSRGDIPKFENGSTEIVNQLPSNHESENSLLVYQRHSEKSEGEPKDSDEKAVQDGLEETQI